MPLEASTLAEKRGGFAPSGRLSNMSSASGASDMVDSVADSSRDAVSRDGGQSVRSLVRCRPLPAHLSGTPCLTFTAESAGGRDQATLKMDGPKDLLERAGFAEDLLRNWKCNAYSGPEAAQEDVFQEVVPVVDAVMRGSNGSVLCYGITGAGKTHTMSGSLEDMTVRQDDLASMGIVQRTATRIFQYIRDTETRSPKVFSLEASFLQIFTSDGTDEHLVDLLADNDRHVEVKQDSSNPSAFTCDGLSKVSIRSPDDVCEALHAGQKRCAHMENTRNFQAARSHCVFMLTVESLSESPSHVETKVQRGKLLLVDLAGSESLRPGADDQQRMQAASIGRTLSSLTSFSKKGASLEQDSALHKLLRDCIGDGGAKALVVANVGPEAESVVDTVKTIRFAQQMMATRSVALSRRSSGSNPAPSALLQMKQRQSECIRMLQEKVADEEAEQKEKLRQEMEELNMRLVTKETADKTLAGEINEQFKRMDMLKQEMSSHMSNQLAETAHSMREGLNGVKQFMEESVTSLAKNQQNKQEEETQARLDKMKDEIETARKLQRSAESEAGDLRVKLASVEERAKMLQARQEELRKERAAFDEERRDLRQQSEQQWQKLMEAEHTLQRFKAELEVQRQERERLQAARKEDEEALKGEKEAAKTREEELNQELLNVRAQLEEVKREGEEQAMRAAKEHREADADLRLKVDKLEHEQRTRMMQLEQTQQAVGRLENEKAMALNREENLRQQSQANILQLEDELANAREHETELMQMLDDIQNSIIQNTNSNKAA